MARIFEEGPRLSSIGRAGAALLLLLGAASCTGDGTPPLPAPIASSGAQAETTPRGGGGLDDPDARDAWEHAYYGGEPSFEYLRYKAQVAASEAKKLRHPRAQLNLAAGTSAAWTNIGPFAGAMNPPDDAVSADSGRLTAIVTDPTNAQIVYVACDGGVFKSTNADVTASTDWTWTAITDSLPASSAHGNAAVGDLAMSPTDPNTLFLGLGDPLDAPSVGFFFTSDGGTTWTQGSNVGTATGVWKIYPVSSSILLVGTDSGLFRSTDGGRSFTPINLGAQPGGYVRSIAGYSNGTIIASHRINANAGEIWYSTDQGQTWAQSTITGSPTSGLDRITLATSGTTAYAIGSNNNTLVPGVFKSTDSGKTFAYVTPNGGSFDTGQGWYNQLLTVDPSNASNVWVGAQIGMYRSFDGGVTWAQAEYGMHSDFHTATWSTTGSKTLYVGNDGGLSVMRDPLRATVPMGGAGADLTYLDNRRNRGLATHEIYYMSSTTGPLAADARYRVSIGTQDNGTRLRTDAGSGLATSGLFDVVLGGDGFGTLYHPYLPNKVAVSENGNLYIHTYGGSYDPLVSPGSLLFGVPVIADPSDVTGQSFYTIGFASTPTNTWSVYRTHDFGQTFTTISPAAWNQTLNTFWAATPTTDPNTIAVIGGGLPNNVPGYISSDNGATWTALGTTSAPVVRSAWFDSKNANVLYLTSVSYDATAHHIWRSIDKGVTFTALDSTTNGMPFGVPIYLVKNDPFDSNTLYAATELGMYVTSDGGATWSRLGTGFPLVAVHDFWEAPDGSMIRAATYGRGAWEIPLGRTANAMSAAISAPSADVTVNSGTTVTFNASSTDGSSTASVSSFWIFGDGTTAMGASASHTFTNTSTVPVTYAATFIAADSSGASAGAARQVTVQPRDDFSLYVTNPNVVCPPPPRICTANFQVPQGTSAPGTVTAQYIGPDPQTIALSVGAGLPAGVTITLSPTSLNATTTTSNMTITVAASAVPGSYQFSIVGTNGTLTHTATYPLTITSTNPITNGDFETGSLSGWTGAGTTSISSTAHGGKYAAMVGATTATNGDSSIAQTFTAPSGGGTLSFWYAVHCPDTVTYDWATATLKDNTAGTTSTMLTNTCTNTGAWTQSSATLVASHSYTLTLFNHDDNYASDPTYVLYDDVTVAAAPPPPPPQPLVNGDFETGSLSGWTSTGSATVSTSVVHGGTYSALLGIIGSPTSDSTLVQSFTAPSTGGTLSFWYDVVCNDTVTYDWATATLKDTTTGTTATILAATCNKSGWAQVSTALVANHGYTLTLTNHDDNYPGDDTHTFFDDVAVQ